MRFSKITIILRIFCGVYCVAQEPIGHDLLLIINYNYPHYESVNFLKELYQSYFPAIVFYGPQGDPEVEFCNHHKGWFSYKTIADAIQKYPQYKGYLLIHDDLIINPWNLQRLDKNKIWISPFWGTADLSLGIQAISWNWWMNNTGYTAIKLVYEELDPKYKEMLIKNFRDNAVLYGYSDIVYVPSSVAQDFCFLANKFASHVVFLEIALPTICACIMHNNDIQFLNGLTEWGFSQGHVTWNGRDKKEVYSVALDYIHPLKLSSELNREFIQHIFQSIYSCTS